MSFSCNSAVWSFLGEFYSGKVLNVDYQIDRLKGGEKGLHSLSGFRRCKRGS